MAGVCGGAGTIRRRVHDRRATRCRHPTPLSSLLRVAGSKRLPPFAAARSRRQPHLQPPRVSQDHRQRSIALVRWRSRRFAWRTAGPSRQSNAATRSTCERERGSRMERWESATRRPTRRAASVESGRRCFRRHSVLSVVLLGGLLWIGGAGRGASAATVTVDARDLVSGSALPRFTYIVNVDNSRFIDRATRQPSDPFPTWLTTESNSPIVAEGDQSRTTVTLPDGRYLVTVRAPDHKMWGKHVTLPQDAGAVRIDLTEASDAHPLPLGKIRVFVFEDNAWTNGAPDDEEAGLGGFQIGLEEQTRNEVTVDYHNAPLCGGICLTNADGFVEVENLGPATYFIDVHPPPGPCNDNPDSQWYQTTTIEGGFSLQAGIEEGSDGTESPGLQLWQPPNVRTAFWFGFICAPTGFAAGGAGAITGTARNWQGWPPFEVLTLGEPVQDPFVALSDASTDRLVYAGRGDSAGNFDIQGVPAGAYNMAIWDEQLSYIIRLTRVTVAEGETVDVNEIDPLGNVGIGVSRWFGWLGGYVYKDLNLNGVMDPGEPVIPNTDVDLRWRDGTIKESTVTGPDGYYEYPTAEGGPLGRWFIG